MKKLFLIAFAFVCFSARAQYFQHLYGTSFANEHLRSGINTVVQGQGHFIAGQNRLTCIQPLSTVPAAFTDIKGNITGAPYFERNYILSVPNGPALHAMGAQVFELDNGAGFGLVGSYIDFSVSPNGGGIYYIQLDGSGNPVNVYNYTVSNTNYRVGSVNGIAESTITSGGNEIYITGGVGDNTSTYPYVLKIDVNNGSINWGWVYDIYTSSTSKYQAGQGVVESPYTPYGNNEIVVVGAAIDYTAGNNTDAILMHIDESNGNMLAPVNFYGTTSSYEEFKSVRISSNTTMGNAGFIIGGVTDNNGGGDFWVVNTDDFGNVNFSNTFDYTASPGVYNFCTDVIERLNTFSTYEYYAVGTTNSGVLGNTDIMVVKIKDNGNATSEFTYGGPNNDMGQMLDQDNAAGGSTPDGLSVYGWWGGASASTNDVDMYIVKAYFNGLSGCNESFNNPTQASGPGLIATVSAIQVVSFNSSNLAISYLDINNTTLCYNSTITGGNNARVAPKDDTKDKAGVLLIPNPAESGTGNVDVVVESDAPGQADVQIYDMAGRQVYTGKFVMTKGTNKLKLDISKSNITPGIYTVQVNGAASGQTILLQVK